MNTKVEATEHQAYYKQGGIEAIDVIEDWNLDFSLGNAVKYISRAGRKDPSDLIKDLSKALWYVHREIDYSNALNFKRVKAGNKFAAKSVAMAWELNEELTNALESIYAAVCLPDSSDFNDFFRTHLYNACCGIEKAIFNLEKQEKGN